MLTQPAARLGPSHPTTTHLARVVLSLGLALAGLAAGAAPRQPTGRARGPAISAERAIAAALQGEVGANDFRLSFMGRDQTFDAFTPAVAYNSVDNQYLVVWRGDDNTGLLADEEHEIFGQRVDAATGAEIGGDIRLSDMGPDGNTAYYALAPAVVYNSHDNEYLVVWSGDDNTGELVAGEFEIFGQRIEAATGAEIGGDFRLSDMGPDGNFLYGAFFPAAAYNSVDNQYLVVWEGDDIGGAVDDELEIFGQRVDAASGAELGGDFRLSDMGLDGNSAYDADMAAVAYNSVDNQYLVVWRGDDNSDGLMNDEYEIFGQRLEGDTGAELGADLRLSDMGPDGNASYAASAPAVTYNGQGNEYLVVWSGDDNNSPLADGEFEIFGQRVNAATGGELGGDFRLSDMGPDGNTNYSAFFPAVAYNNADNQYLVVWSGDDNNSPLADGEFEIFGQRLNAATGAEIAGDIRLSSMGPDGNASYGAFDLAVAYNSQDNQYLAVWRGDDNNSPLADEEFEIFGQRVDAATGARRGAGTRFSDMGGDVLYDAFTPAVAYNSQDNEYLVVWYGDDNSGGLVDNESEVFGQRVNAATGVAIGSRLRLSDVGPDGNTAYNALAPAVAYNSRDNQYLVVWYGDDNSGGLVDNESEVFGQRVDAATGGELGADFRLSDMGPDGNTNYSAFFPAVAYNGEDNQYLVVWYGDDNTGGLADGEFEIFGQRVNAATGGELGGDFRLSDMGPDGNAVYEARNPAVAYNSVNNQYLVVWWGDDNTGGLVNDEFEIYGQRVEAATGAEVGADTRLSEMRPDGNANYDAFYPAVAYNNADNQYLVVWHGADNTVGLAASEYEIFGQRVDAATGAELGGDIRLSDMGPDGNPAYQTFFPAVAYNSMDNQYLVVWEGDDNTGGLVENELEVFGQRVDAATGAEVGADTRLSDMGPDSSKNYGGSSPAVAYNSVNDEYLVVWHGDDNSGGLDEEYEIYGQRLLSQPRLYLPVVKR